MEIENAHLGSIKAPLGCADTNTYYTGFIGNFVIVEHEFEFSIKLQHKKESKAIAFIVSQPGTRQSN